jgi:hypothetical protein
MNYEISIADICALAFSGFAIYITLTNRRNSLRENLYNRQIDDFQKVINDIIDIEDVLDEYLAEKEMDEKVEMETFKTKAIEGIEKFLHFEMKVALLMPDKIDIEISKVTFQLTAIVGKLYRSEFTNEDSEELGNAIFELEQKIRSFIGLEKLSRENQRLTKSVIGAGN